MRKKKFRKAIVPVIVLSFRFY